MIFNEKIMFNKISRNLNLVICWHPTDCHIQPIGILYGANSLQVLVMAAGLLPPARNRPWLPWDMPTQLNVCIKHVVVMMEISIHWFLGQNLPSNAHSRALKSNFDWDVSKRAGSRSLKNYGQPMPCRWSTEDLIWSVLYIISPPLRFFPSVFLFAKVPV